MSAFAARLAELRRAAGLSQGQLARLVGLSRQAVSNLEAGRNVPAWLTVQLLAKALEAPLDAFADPALELPESQPKRSAGRPRKAAAAPPESPRRRRAAKRRDGGQA